MFFLNKEDEKLYEYDESDVVAFRENITDRQVVEVNGEFFIVTTHKGEGAMDYGEAVSEERAKRESILLGVDREKYENTFDIELEEVNK
jgi:hypothetical protein